MTDNRLTPSSQLSLYGKRILITAPRNYAARFAQQIIYQGGLPFLAPTIETCYLTDPAPLDESLQHLNTFDWIAFTSRNGIDALLQRMEQLGLSLASLNHCQLCAIGQDAERLTALGLTVDLSPVEPSPMGIIHELAKKSDIQGKRILVPAPEVIGLPEPDVIPNFIAELNCLGLQVTRTPAYVTRCLDPANYSVELDLIRQGKIDVIAFSSTGEVEGFLKMVNSIDDHAQCQIACFGPYTAANAQRLGLPVSIIAEDYSSFAGFVKAIAAFFKKSSL
ncbi:MAG: uroporphyrinogen-III synthase [Leptolyngbyaceae cyanobacterium MO_188.B28]|nr:uroporphyrinogen-III synthase [Leptolyngbyaceae cyanobacterium MO_188.B28]